MSRITMGTCDNIELKYTCPFNDDGYCTDGFSCIDLDNEFYYEEMFKNC